MEGRRVMHQLLNGAALKTYGEWQESESVRLLAAYLRQLERWYAYYFRYSASIVYRTVAGEQLLKPTSDLEDLQQVTIEFIRSINLSIIDFFPCLAKLPRAFQPWRKYWEDMGNFYHDVLQKWWKPIKQAVSNNTAPPSFVRDILLHSATKYTGNDEDAVLSYPQFFQKARDEVDSICGNAQRLPRLEDMAKMPYTCATIKEVLRWRPVVPLIPQHQLVQDLEFEGYHFPAGIDFVINSVALCGDCKAPGEFTPERWLDGTEGSITSNLWQFRGGRRVCVGYRIAQQELFIAFARLCYCFDFAAVRPTWHLTA